MLHAAALAFLIGSVIWILAGEIKLALTVFPSEAAMKFHLDEDGLYRLRFDEIPSGIRSGFWMDAIMDMRCRQLAMDCIDGESWILTDKGEELRKFSETLCSRRNDAGTKKHSEYPHSKAVGQNG